MTKIKEDVLYDIKRLLNEKDERGWTDKGIAHVINTLHGTSHTKDSIRSVRRRYHTGSHGTSNVLDSVVEKHNTEVYDVNKTSGWQRKVKVYSKEPVGFIGDLHAPFTEKGYISFCKETFDYYGCDLTISVGDIVDQYALSLFDKDPEAYSAQNELLKAIDTVDYLGKLFPRLHVTVGNHDVRYLRAALKTGLPKAFLRDLGEVLEAPETWDWNYSYILNDDTLIEHGTSAGANATVDRAWSTSMNVVQGHTHNYAGVQYRNCGFKTRWGFNVGCGLDIDSYAAKYSINWKYQPTLGCGVLVDGIPIFVPFNY